MTLGRFAEGSVSSRIRRAGVSLSKCWKALNCTCSAFPGLSADGRLLVPLAPRDSWFNPPAVIDTSTGKLVRVFPAGDQAHGLTFFPSPGDRCTGHNGVVAHIVVSHNNDTAASQLLLMLLLR